MDGSTNTRTVRSSMTDARVLQEFYDMWLNLFALKVFHNGYFTQPPGRRYFGGFVDFIDGVDPDYFCLHDLDEIIAELGFLGNEKMWYTFKKPNCDLDTGVHDLGSDDDLRFMFSFIPRYREIEVYVLEGGKNLTDYFNTIIPKRNSVPRVTIEELEEDPTVTIEEVEVVPKVTIEEVHTVHETSSSRKKLMIEWHQFDEGCSSNPHDSGKDLGNEASREKSDRGDVNDEGSDDDEEERFEEFLAPEEEINMDDLPNLEADMAGNEDEANTKEQVDLEGSDSRSGSDVDEAREREIRKLKKENECGKEGDKEVSFYVGKGFACKQDVLSAVRLHAIQSRRKLHIKKNDKVRVRVLCNGGVPQFTGEGKFEGQLKDEKCPWYLLVSCPERDQTWRVKTLTDTHTCMKTMTVKYCDQNFLAEQLLSSLAPNPKMPIPAVKHQLETAFEQHLTPFKCYKAKAIALKKLRGDFSKQYGYLRDYTLELQRANPDTTVKLDVAPHPNHSESVMFSRIYVCFGALKKGFKACSRELLGLDGAFIKGPFPGQILTAVGVDPNSGIYPLAYAVVESESRDSWTWFLEILRDDLGLTVDSNFTFMSDRQKGIIPAVATIFPNAEHRFCVLHIHENMAKRWKGKLVKKHLWKCARATTVPTFKSAMRAFKEFSEEAHKYLSEIPPAHWSKAHFSVRSHCDMLLNNVCEVFNKQLVEARERPILSCLEYIREYLMRRIVRVQRRIAKSNGLLTPTATALFKEIKDSAVGYLVTWNGDNKFEVKGPWDDQCVVEVCANKCTCRVWELTGMPCKHAVAALWYMALNKEKVGIPETYVHKCYWLRTWKEIYDHKLQPLNGRQYWPELECTVKIMPPPHHPHVGRPTKKRKRAVDELKAPLVQGKKLRRLGKTVTCTKCKQRGHNSRTCKGVAVTSFV